MKSWNDVWGQIISDPEIKKEYKKAFLLNMFQKVCAKMKKDQSFCKKVLTLLRQTTDTKEATKAIIRREYGYELDEEETNLFDQWFDAYRKKKPKRKVISQSVKRILYEEQNGLCAACGQDLGCDWSKIHVDHIVPWALVGDELEDNYQALCQTCNECKNSKTDYIFKKMINLT